MAKETIGSPVSDKLHNQIKVRQDILGNDVKSPAEISYLNSSTAWVKLRSSVNSISIEQAQQIARGEKTREEIKGSSTAANNFILTGGLLTEEGGRYGINYKPGTQPVKFNQNTGEGEVASKSAYSNYSSMGIRPMPGITSLKVTSKNTYGTLQEASVDFSLFSKEDLEIAELLYFRPGYTALLEWGHSLYYSNDRKLQYVNDSYTVSNKFFFAHKTSDEIDSEIDRLKSNSDGNYEGLFGYVTNFNWSFRNDGGYDCSVKIVSRGVILESLKVGKTYSATQNKKVENDDTTVFKNDVKSIYHTIFERIEANKDDNKTSADIKSILDRYGLEKISSKLEFNTYSIPFTSEEPGWFDFGSDVNNLSYISLRGFLSIFNNFNSIFNTAVENPKPEISFDLEAEDKFLTFNKHFSIHPVIALTPKVPGVSELSITNRGLHQTVQTDSNPNDEILNILVSTYFLKNALNRVIDGPQEEGVGIFDVIRYVLSSINDAFGGINQLDIVNYPEQPSLYRVVDRSGVGMAKKPKTINVTGKSSTITNLSITSEISNRTAAQISIAAQGNTGTYSENLDNLLSWNRGAIDRHIVVKNENKQKTATKVIIDPLRDPDTGEDSEIYIKFKEAYKQFNSSDDSPLVFIESEWSNLKIEGTSLMNRLLRASESSKTSQAKPIPVVLSLQMQGLGGFKVGSVFKVNKLVLPDRYDGFGFIITGVEHSVSADNKWLTSLRTQFFQIE